MKRLGLVSDLSLSKTEDGRVSPIKGQMGDAGGADKKNSLDSYWKGAFYFVSLLQNRLCEGFLGEQTKGLACGKRLS
jgi:hypothetical protein